MKVPSPACPSKTRRFLRIDPDRGCRDVDREVLVIVAGPGDPGPQVNVVAEDAEAEARRLAARGVDVVDGRRDWRGNEPPQGRGHDARPDVRAHRARRRVGFEDRLRAPGGRLRVDAEADRQVDADVVDVPDRRFERAHRGVVDDELGEADVRVPCRLREELARGVNGAFRGVRAAGSRLPAVVALRRVVLRGDDAGRLSHRRARCKRRGDDPRRKKTPGPCNPHTSGRRVSNPRPRAWEARALPAELRPRVGLILRPAGGCRDRAGSNLRPL